MNILRSLSNRSAQSKRSKLAQSGKSGEGRDGKGGDGQSESGLDGDFHKVDASTSGDTVAGGIHTDVQRPDVEATTNVGIVVKPSQTDVGWQPEVTTRQDGSGLLDHEEDDGDEQFYDTEDPGLETDTESLISNDDFERRDGDLPKLTASTLDWNWVPVADDEVIELSRSPITEEQFKIFLSDVNSKVEAYLTELDKKDFTLMEAEGNFFRIDSAIQSDLEKLSKRTTATMKRFLASDTRLDALKSQLKQMDFERRSVLGYVEEFGETQQMLEKLEELWERWTAFQESVERVRTEQDKVQDEFSRCIFGTKGSGGGGD